MEWRDEDGKVRPEFQPLVEAGQGESEGFELAEEELVRNATHEDEHPTSTVLDDADARSEEASGAEFGEADSERHPDA